MKQWTSFDRIWRLVVVLLLCFPISFLIKPETLRVILHMFVASAAISDWLRVPLALLLVAIAYIAFLWRVKPPIKEYATWLFRLLYVLELALGVTFRFWWKHCWWLLAYGVASGLTVAGLSLLSRKKTAAHENKDYQRTFLIDAPTHEDKLQRQTLAENIDLHKDPQPYCIGLFGGWGTGKTTLMNYLRSELENSGHKTG